MANDLTLTEEDNVIVYHSWTKLVSKASDIVRNQKANMKTNAATLQTSPNQKDKLDSLFGLLDNSLTNNNEEQQKCFNKEITTHDLINLGLTNECVTEECISISEVPAQVLLARKIEETLREAKKTTLLCEVLVPCELTSRISADIVRMSEYEPCGLRGCVVIFNLEEKNVANSRKIGKMKFDPETVATFELHLTLRRDSGSWLSLRQLVPAKLLKKIGKSPALIISEQYTLSKKKLYRSSSETY